MVLGNDFTDVMGYLDVAAEKCGHVVEMWLGMLDLANMTKSQITFMETKADPGELLAGLEASLNIFHGTTRSTTTPIHQERWIEDYRIHEPRRGFRELDPA